MTPQVFTSVRPAWLTIATPVTTTLGGRQYVASRIWRSGLRRWWSEPRDELVGSIRDRPRRHDPGDGYRAGDGDHARCRIHTAHRLHHDHRLPPVPAAGRALGDDARAHGRLALLCVRRLQGQVAAVRQARERR